MTEESTNKDTEVYRKIIKSQNCTHTEVCEVIQELFKNRIVCKSNGKQYTWYIVNNDNYVQTNEHQIRKMIFKKLISLYNQTAEFLYVNAFSDGQLIKYHYIEIANRLVRVSRFLNIISFKNNVMKELIEVLCN